MSSNFKDNKKVSKKKTKEEKQQEEKEKEERKKEKEEIERIDAEIKKKLENIIEYVKLSKTIEIDFDKSTQTTLDNIRLIAESHINIKAELFMIELNKDNITEERNKQIKETIKIYKEAITELKTKLTAFKRLDDGFRKILGVGIVKAMEDIIIVNQCRSLYNVDLIIKECHPMDDEYICVCGKEGLVNLLVCHHPNLPKTENMIIGSVCCEHFEIFALLQSCKESKNNFLKIYKYAKKTKYKLTKKKCIKCDKYKVQISNDFKGEEIIKNDVCSNCYKIYKCVNGNITYKTKCLSCDNFINYKMDKCISCEKKEKNNSKKIIYNF